MDGSSTGLSPIGDRLRCRITNKDSHGKYAAAAHELVVLYSTINVELTLTNKMFLVGPGFCNNKIPPQNATHSPVQFIFLIHDAFFFFFD